MLSGRYTLSLIAGGLFIYYFVSTELTPEQRAAAREASTDTIATTMWACPLRFILTDAAPSCDVGEGRDITKAFASAFRRCPARTAPAR